MIAWYDVLLGVRDSPSARLGRASAVAERDGAAAGLDDEAGIERAAAERLGLNAGALASLDSSLAAPPR